MRGRLHRVIHYILNPVVLSRALKKFTKYKILINRK